MANWNKINTVVTKLGSKLVSYAVAGVATLDLTRVVVRDTVSTASTNYNYTLADITDIKQTGRLLKRAGGVGDDTDATLVSVRFSNSELSDNTTFNIRQIVLLAQLKDIDADAMSQYDPDFVNPGEVPFLVAQSSGESDYDLMPPKKDNPTSFDYDLYVIHTGVPTISVSIQTTGYVHETDFNNTVAEINGNITNINTEINNIKANEVGEHTNNKNYKNGSWLPVYNETIDSETGMRTVTWSTTDSILSTESFNGKKSAERFNQYEEYDSENPDIVGNISVGYYSHAEGGENLTLSPESHVEGNQNYIGCSLDATTIDTDHNANKGTHVEGTQNTAVNFFTQHVEGAINFSEGYCNHTEGKENFNKGSVSHVSGIKNKLTSGMYSRVGGFSNTVTSCNVTSVEGSLNSVANCEYSFISGRENDITACSYAIITGLMNTVSQSNSTYILGSYNSASMENTFTSILGSYNTVSHTVSSVVSGKQNTTDNVSYSFITGIQNRASVQVANCILTGNLNLLSKEVFDSSADSFISGNHNTLVDIRNSVISGNYNTLQYVQCSIVLGANNVVELDLYEGSKTSSRGIFNSVVSGTYNEVKHTENSVISGRNNEIKDYRPHNVPNEWRLSSHNVIAGEYNSADGIYSSALVGQNNDVTNLHDSIIGGSNNNVTGLDTPITGYSNSVLCMSIRANVENHYYPQAVFGTDVTVKGNNSLTSGEQLKSSSNNSLTVGKFNVEDTTNTYAVVVGGGTADNNRSNIATLDWTGKLTISDISIGTISSLLAKIAELEEAIQRLTPPET